MHNIIVFEISIHAPPRGATIQNMVHRKWHKFQFTSLREGRRRLLMRFLNLIDFNSRPSARGDFVRRSSEGVQSRFQFTPLREGRRQRPPHPTIAMPFQFPPLREGRPGIQQDALSGILFQFTPLREGRHLPRGCFLRQLNFNSRPSARGDPNFCTRSQSGV